MPQGALLQLQRSTQHRARQHGERGQRMPLAAAPHDPSPDFMCNSLPAHFFGAQIAFCVG